MKKIHLAAACVLLCGSLFAAGGKDSSQNKAVQMNDENVNLVGFPIAKKQIDLTVFGSRDSNHTEWKNMKMFNEYEKKTNIKMIFQETPSQGFDEKKNLLFVSNELPDVFFRAMLTPVEITKYGVESRQLIPLNDLINRYAPNIKKILDENPLIKNAMTASDGNIYALPELDFSATGRAGFKQWINKDWLAAVNKKMPTTTDEFIDVLRAFRDGDPNKNGKKDEIPFGIREPTSVYVLGGSFGLEWQMGNTINVANNKVHIWLKDDKFKSYLQFLNKLYTEKLLWQEYYKNPRPEWRANLANALFGVMEMPYSDVFLSVEKQFTALPPLKGPSGDQLWADVKTGINNIGAFALSNTCKNPVAAIRWVDYFYGDEGEMYIRYGIEGDTFYYDADKQPVFKDEILKDPKGFMTALGRINTAPGALNPVRVTNLTDGVVASKLTKQVAEVFVPYFPKKIYATPSFTQEESEQYVAIVQDLDKYRDEAVTKFILGEWSFDKWNEYCQTLDKIGLPKLEALYQKAFDRQYK